MAPNCNKSNLPQRGTNSTAERIVLACPVPMLNTPVSVISNSRTRRSAASGAQMKSRCCLPGVMRTGSPA